MDNDTVALNVTEKKPESFYPPVDVEVSVNVFKFYCKNCNTLNVDYLDRDIRGLDIDCQVCGTHYRVNR